MPNSMSEFVALIKEFCTDVLQLNAVIGIAVMIILFILEVRWTRSHPPRSRRKERAVALGHVVTARRVSYWDDGVTPDEKTTSWYHATYAYEVAEKQYQYKYLARFSSCANQALLSWQPRQSILQQRKTKCAFSNFSSVPDCGRRSGDALAGCKVIAARLPAGARGLCQMDFKIL